MDLVALGLADADLRGTSVAEVGRVCGSTGRAFQVCTEAGQHIALLPGATRTATGEPVVGDWVRLAASSGQLLIEDILPRQTAVRRMSTHLEGHEHVLASNVDIVFVCFPARAVSPYLIESWGHAIRSTLPVSGRSGMTRSG